jgi:hypothetical protein
VSEYPVNVVEVLKIGLATALAIKHPDMTFNIFKRPLDFQDPSNSLGIAALDWEPVISSMEIGSNLGEPTISRYNYVVQFFCKHSNEEAGESTHAQVTRSIRWAIYRDATIKAGLAALTVNGPDGIERFMRCGIQSQRFANNDDKKGSFLFLSVTEFYVETETV